MGMQEQTSLGGFHSDLQPSSIYSAFPGARSQPSVPWQVSAGQTRKQTLDPVPEALPLGSEKRGWVVPSGPPELAGASCEVCTGLSFHRNSLKESTPVFLDEQLSFKVSIKMIIPGTGMVGGGVGPKLGATLSHWVTLKSLLSCDSALLH